MDAAEKYYASEYHRRNMLVASVCGAHAAVEQALERALSIKSIPNWMIAYLESANNRIPGLQYDLAAWRDLAPDAPETVRRAPDPRDEAIRALVEAAEAVRDAGERQMVAMHNGKRFDAAQYPIVPVDAKAWADLCAALAKVKEAGK